MDISQAPSIVAFVEGIVTAASNHTVTGVQSSRPDGEAVYDRGIYELITFWPNNLRLAIKGLLD